MLTVAEVHRHSEYHIEAEKGGKGYVGPFSDKK
jgi:hypothetical protein